MRKFISKLLCGETLRYLIFGVLTVVFNIVLYRILSWKLSTLKANTIAFFLSVLFAYCTNSTFVFRPPHTWKNFSQFVGMRLGTLVIDDGGMYLLTALGVNDMAAKYIISVIIIAINYLISKLIIFRKK